MTAFISRAEEDAPVFFSELRAAGAEVYGCSLIRTEPATDTESIRSAIGTEPVESVVFTSRRAVDHWVRLSPGIGDPVIICAGPQTAAAARAAGLRGVEEAPPGQDGVLEYLSRASHSGRDGAERKARGRILFPRSALAGSELRRSLRGLGFTVVEVELYRPIPDDSPDTKLVLQNLRAKPAGIYAFTSPSSFDAYLALAGIDNPADHFAQARILAIGTTTARAIEAGCGPVRVAAEPSITGLTNLALEVIGGSSGE